MQFNSLFRKVLVFLLSLPLGFSFLISEPLKSVNAANPEPTASGRIIPPAVDCDPYTPTADATNYSINISGAVNTSAASGKVTSSSLRIYLYAATLYNLKFVQEDFNPSPPYNYGTFTSLNVPANFACVSQTSVDGNLNYNFSNLQVKYTMPDTPDIKLSYDISKNKIISKRTIFFVRVHDESGNLVDSWGTANIGPNSQPAILLGSAAAVKSQLVMPFQIYGEIANARPYFYSHPRRYEVNTEHHIFYSVDFFRDYGGGPETKSFDDAWAWMQLYCNVPGQYHWDEGRDPEYRPDGQNCDMPADDITHVYYPDGYTSWLEWVNGDSTFFSDWQTYIRGIATSPSSASQDYTYGLTAGINNAVSGTKNIEMSVLTAASQPPIINFPDNLKVGDTFNVPASTPDCYNSQKQPLTKNSDSTYIISVQDYNKQIYCSQDKTIDITTGVEPYALIFPLHWTLEHVSTNGCQVFVGTGVPYANTYWDCILRPEALVKIYADEPALSTYQYTYETQSNWSKPVEAATPTIYSPAYWYNNQGDHYSMPTTGISSQVNLDESKCTISSGLCADDPNFQYTWQWQRWTGTVWQTVSNTDTYTPVSSDWSNAYEGQSGVIQIVLNLEYTGPNAGAYAPVTHSEIVQIYKGQTPSFSYNLICHQTAANKAFYPDGTCAMGDTLEAQADFSPGFDDHQYTWSIGSTGSTDSKPIDNNNPILLLTPEVFNLEPKCQQAFTQHTGGCGIYADVYQSSLGYNSGQGTPNHQKLDFKQGVNPMDYTPSLIYNSAGNYPMVGDKVALSGLYNPSGGWGSSCKISLLDSQGAETLIQDWTNCTPGATDYGYVPTIDQLGKKLKIGVKTVNSLAPSGYISYDSTYDSVTTKYLISPAIDKGSALPSGTLKFDPAHKDAKVAALLQVVGVPEGWSIQSGTCKIVLSDGTDITNSPNAKCTDAQLSYIPEASDLGKKVTFSAIWIREGYYDSPLTITSTTAVQKGDPVVPPAKVTGLVQNGMVVYLSGVDLSDWKLTQCQLYRTSAGQTDQLLQDCMDPSSRSYMVKTADVGSNLKLATHYVRDGYNDSVGTFTTNAVSPGDYPYPLGLDIVSDNYTSGQTEIRVDKQVIVLGLPDKSSGWTSDIHWQVCSVNCSSPDAEWVNTDQTSEIFMASSNDLGKYVRVVSHETKDGFTSSDLHSASYEVLPSSDPVFSPVITGNLNVGQILTTFNIPSPSDLEWSNISFKWYKKLLSEPDSSKTLLDNTKRQLALDSSLFGFQVQVEVTAQSSLQGKVVKVSDWTNLISEGLPVAFSPNIVGETFVGEELLVTSLPSAETGWSNAQFQWYRADSDNPSNYTAIVGAVEPYYGIVPADLGYRIMLKVVLNNTSSAYMPSEVSIYAGVDTSDQYGTVVVKGQPTIFSPVIVGQAVMGSLLSLTSILPISDFSLQYQWQRCNANCDDDSSWNNITGATLNTYSTIKDDVGQDIRAKIVAQHLKDPEAYEYSVGVSNILQIAKGPAPIFNPILSGNFKVGEIVSTKGFPNSAWQVNSCTWYLYNSAGGTVKVVSGTPLAFGCQPYIIGQADLGLKLQLTATATHINDSQFYEQASGTSDISQIITEGQIPPFTPALSGLMKVGTTLSLIGLPLNLSGAVFTYTWAKKATPTSSPVALPNTPNNYLDLTADMLGFYISSTVKISLAGYSDYYVTTQTNSVVTKGSPIVFTPTIYGVAKVGEVLQVYGTPDPALGWQLSYLWIDSTGKTLSTDSVYSPIPSDIAKSLLVSVKASKPGFEDASVQSAATQTVALGDGIVFSPKIGGVNDNNQASVGAILQALNLPDKSTGWTISYAWYFKDNDNYVKIDNSDNADYMPVSQDVGKNIYLGAKAVKLGYQDSFYYSVNSATITLANFPDYKVSFDGPATVGNTISVVITPVPDTSPLLAITYKWFVADSTTSGGLQIQSAVNSQFMPNSDVEGKYIYAEVDFKQVGFNDLTIFTNRVFVSSPIDPVFVPTFVTPVSTALGTVLVVNQASLPPSPYFMSYIKWYELVGSSPDIEHDKLLKTSIKTDYSFNLDNPDYVGKTIYAVVTVSDPGVKTVNGQTALVGPITIGEIEDFTPVISETSPRVDYDLTVYGLPSKDPLSPAWVPDYSFTYKWFVGGVEVDQSSHYQVKGSDIGKQISVQVKATRQGYNAKTGVSLDTIQVANGLSVVFEPTLQGAFIVEAGAITVEGLVQSFTPSFEVQTCVNPQDQTSCVPIQNQPAFAKNSFVPTVEMADKNIRVKVILRKTYYEDSIAYTPITGKILASQLLKDYVPIIDGQSKVGLQVATSNIIEEIDPVTSQAVQYNYIYQWQISDDNEVFTNIAGATQSIYQIKVADFSQTPKKYLRVEVTISRDGYQQTVKDSVSNEVKPGDIPYTLPTITYCPNNLAGQDNITVYKVGIGLSVCGLPQDFADSKFNFTYKWFTDSNSSGQDKVEVSRDSQWTPVAKDLDKYIFTEITMVAQGYNDALVLINSDKNRVDKGLPINLSEISFSTDSPKVTDTIRIIAVPVVDWKYSYNIKLIDGLQSKDYYSCQGTLQSNCKDSFKVSSGMYNKVIQLEIVAFRQGYEQSSKVLATNPVALGDSISFSPVISPVNLNTRGDIEPAKLIKVGAPLEILGTPKFGDSALPFGDFTTDSEWLNADGSVISTSSIFTPTPDLMNQNITCQVKISAVGFADSVGVCSSVLVNAGDAVDLSSLSIVGTVQSKHYLSFTGLPDYDEGGWNLDSLVWAACDNITDNPMSDCTSLATYYNLGDYSKNSPSYELMDNQIGKYIKVVFEFSKYGFMSANKVVSTTETVKVGQAPYFDPQINGKNRVGKRFLALGAPADSSGWKTKYQWLADGKAIAGATENSFVLTPNELGKNVAVQMTIYNPRVAYRGITDTKISKEINILVGLPLVVNQNGFSPKLFHNTNFAIPFYMIQGSVAEALGWQQNIFWVFNGQIEAGQNGTCWASLAPRNNVSVIMNLSKAGYQSSQIVLR
ncbi:MAG: hypothetical protein LBT99_00160 [Bifidobacteriaceae bacterium]|nr:hypothetical protein [Bifidobacteriaceae bacterium]